MDGTVAGKRMASLTIQTTQNRQKYEWHDLCV